MSNVAGGEPIDLTDTSGNNKVVISYRDDQQMVNALDWSVSWDVTTDDDNLLEEGELAKITISELDCDNVTNTLTTP